jgi:dTDP-4-amino-4,6-dideoxygalactose transaminase
MNPDLLEAAITSRTKAILPVHLSGYPAQLDKIMAVADKHGLAVVEDCAQAHGTEYQGRKVGSFGDVGISSFQNSKFMASGEGGLIFTNDESIWEKCHSYKDCGRLRRGDDYVDYLSAYEEGGWGFGWNYRFTEFQAGVLLAQMERLEEHKAIRFRNATWLNEQLGQIKGIRPLPLHPGQNVWRYTFDYDSRAFSDLPLDRFIAAVQAEGIPLNHFHPRPVHTEGLFLGYIRQPAWAPGLIDNPHDYKNVQAPVADKAYREKVVFLKNNILLGSRQDMADIVAAITKVQQYAGELME